MEYDGMVDDLQPFTELLHRVCGAARCSPSLKKYPYPMKLSMAHHPILTHQLHIFIPQVVVVVRDGCCRCVVVVHYIEVVVVSLSSSITLRLLLCHHRLLL